MAARLRRQPAACKSQIAEPYQKHFRRNTSVPNSSPAVRNPSNGIQGEAIGNTAPMIRSEAVYKPYPALAFALLAVIIAA